MPRLLCRTLIVAAVVTGIALGSVATTPVASQVTGQDSVAKVWVNTGSGVYHCPGTRYYGATKAGVYLHEDAARSKGYRPAYGRVCSPAATIPEKAPAATPLATVTPGKQVWVNTGSGVYHCPGTRYYGATKAGKYMPEPAARSSGYRPAYGRTCS